MKVKAIEIGFVVMNVKVIGNGLHVNEILHVSNEPLQETVMDNKIPLLDGVTLGASTVAREDGNLVKLTV